LRHRNFTDLFLYSPIFCLFFEASQINSSLRKKGTQKTSCLLWMFLLYEEIFMWEVLFNYYATTCTFILPSIHKWPSICGVCVCVPVSSLLCLIFPSKTLKKREEEYPNYCLCSCSYNVCMLLILSSSSLFIPFYSYAIA